IKGAVMAAVLKSMAIRPIVFAMANLDPEITYDEAKAARNDIIMATGRSDYPSQVNNVLRCPFIFPASLDDHATAINEEMNLPQLVRWPVSRERMCLIRYVALRASSASHSVPTTSFQSRPIHAFWSGRPPQ